jgi:hypothetical protein
MNWSGRIGRKGSGTFFLAVCAALGFAAGADPAPDVRLLLSFEEEEHEHGPS